MSRRGFTLVELMVTISIIAILATIAISTYSTFQKSARDAKRKSDLATIQSALEQYHADQLLYPIQGNVGIGSSLINPGGTRTYLSRIPSDPSDPPYPEYLYYPMQANGSVCTLSSTPCTRYCLFAQVEQTSSQNVTTCTPPALFTQPYSAVSP